MDERGAAQIEADADILAGGSAAVKRVGASDDAPTCSSIPRVVDSLGDNAGEAGHARVSAF